MSVSEHANYLLNEYGRLQFDYAAYCKPYGESLRNEARNNLEEYIAELEAERLECGEIVKECNDVATPIDVALRKRIAKLELGLNNQTVHSNTLQKILTEKLDRIAELEHDLTNKEIEYTDLWDDALAFQSRIAELEAERDQAKAIVSRLRDFLFDYTQFHISTNPEERWWALVDKFDELVKEREE